MIRIVLFWMLSAMALPQSHAQQEAELLGRWSVDSLIGSNAYNNVYNEIWGLALDGREYAVIGSTIGTHFIDITDPDQPEQVQFVAGASQGGEIIHRDYHDHNNYLYAVSDEGESTLQIIDYSALPGNIEVVYNSGSLIRQAHNIFIDNENELLYAFATNGDLWNEYPMRVYDISNPMIPIFLSEHNRFGSTIVGHVHDAIVRDNIAFLNCGGDGFFIVDFSDPYNPELLSSITDYPDKGYNHSGWLSDDGQYYYMADETHGFDLKVIDVEDPCDAHVVSTFDADVENLNSITHNQIVSCNYLYTSYYYDGLQVFDIIDRENPQKVLYYDTYQEVDGDSYKGAWGIYPFLPSGRILVSDMQTGLYVFEGVGDDCHNIKEIAPLVDSCEQQLTPTVTHLSMIEGLYPQPVSAGGELTVETGLRTSEIVSAVLMSFDGALMQEWKSLSIENGKLELPLDMKLASGMYALTFNTLSGRSKVPVKVIIIQ